MQKNIIYKLIALMVFGMVCESHAQTEITINTKMIIKPHLELIQVKNENDFLQCNIETIENFQCGTGTFLENGQCTVADNGQGQSDPFSLEWEINDVDTCWGTQGTAEWRTTLPPYAGGTGNYNKTLQNGISQNTNFKLNCASADAFNFTGKVLSAEHQAIQFEKVDHRLLIWEETGLRLVQKSGYSDVVDRTVKAFENNVTTYFEITDNKPTKGSDGQLVYSPMQNNGLCSTLGENGMPTALHISPSAMFKDTCGLKSGKIYHIVMVKMIDGKRSHINPYFKKDVLK